MEAHSPYPSYDKRRRLLAMEVILFTSPKAGSGAARDQIPRLIDLLDAAGVVNHALTCPRQLRQIATERRETGVPQPIVVAIGGDGTLSLIAKHTDPDTPLVAMPMGTENLLARHFGQRNEAEAVMRTLQAGRSVQIDAGMANDRLFLIMATVGFDAEVVRSLHLRRKGHIRRSSYLKPIFQTLLRYRFPILRVTAMDDSGNQIDRRDVGWAMAFNLPCYGGNLRILREAVADDARLDLITFAGRGVISGVRYLIGIVLGFHDRFSDVKQQRVSRIRIESESRVAYELDGDHAGRLPLEIKLLPRRIRLLIPPTKVI